MMIGTIACIRSAFPEIRIGSRILGSIVSERRDESHHRVTLLCLRGGLLNLGGDSFKSFLHPCHITERISLAVGLRLRLICRNGSRVGLLHRLAEHPHAFVEAGISLAKLAQFAFAGGDIMIGNSLPTLRWRRRCRGWGGVIYG